MKRKLFAALYVALFVLIGCDDPNNIEDIHDLHTHTPIKVLESLDGLIFVKRCESRPYA